jgi:hypothetical protein
MIAGSTRPRILTFATLPAAGAYPGEVVRVSDIGPSGSTWEWTGTLWRPVNGVLRQHRLTATLGGANNSDAQVLDYTTFPVGLLAVGDEIEVFVRGAKSGTSDTVAVKILFGVTFDPAENSAFSMNLTTTTAYMATRQRFRVTASAIARVTLNAAEDTGTTTVNPIASIVYDPAFDHYMSISTQRTSGVTETSSIYAFSVVVYK